MNLGGSISMSRNLVRPAVCAAVLVGLAAPALAHHGFGLFQMDQMRHWSGTLTKMNLVNPHSYMELDVKGADGKPLHMRCEMRAASLLKRSGWDASMFKVGAHVEIKGDRKSTRLNSSHIPLSRMPSSA